MNFIETEPLKTTKNFAYRYEDCLISYSGVYVVLREIPIVKFTPKGFWIYGIGYHRLGRFVPTNTRKKFACLTKEDAKISFIARKKSQIRIVSQQLDRAKTALYLIEHIKK